MLGRAGIRALILTNAAGGINVEYGQGALVMLRDHINLQGQNPLTGANDERFGPRFPDMSYTYAKRYREIALEEAKKLAIAPREGVYAALAGPSYETPAEIRYLRTIGADLVGMSTVPEAIAARHMGMNVLAISCVTNMAAGILDKALVHEEVLEVGRRVMGQFIALLRAVLPRIAEELQSRDRRSQRDHFRGSNGDQVRPLGGTTEVEPFPKPSRSAPDSVPASIIGMAIIPEGL